MDDRDYQYQQYISYRESNPYERISYSKWKLKRKIVAKQDKYRETSQRLTNKAYYYENKCKELREDIKKLKSDHKAEIAEVKKSRNVKWIRKVKYVRSCECGSKEKRQLLEKPIDKLGKKSANLLKTILGTQNVLGEQKNINSNELQILCLSTLVEYLDLVTVMSWLGLRRTTVFMGLQRLTKLGYLTIINSKAIGGRKTKNKYYLNTIGEEYLQGVINTIGRRTYNIIK